MDSKPYFLHCNHCLIQTNINDNNYHLTQCGAIYCQQCISQFSQNCLKCDQNQCQRVLLVNAIKSEQFQVFFKESPISHICKQLEKVDEFQRFQRKNLIDGLRKQLLERKREITQLNNDLDATKTEIESLKNIIQNLQNQNLITPKSQMLSDDSLKQNLNETNISFKSLFDEFNNVTQIPPKNISEMMPMSPASNQSSISLLSSRYLTNSNASQSKQKFGSICGSTANSRITLSSSRKTNWKSNNNPQHSSHALFNAYTPSASSSRSNATITPTSSIMSSRFGSNNRFVADMRPKLTRTVYDNQPNNSLYVM